ncbi:MAG: nucleoside triphosphate pyrophosphohydrolase [Xenococcus sp. MO_188.B8]|nr:nucleoside triphosphate pyrophosphohydrolase [Xenococcus sp. MO_188.B8]
MNDSNSSVITYNSILKSLQKLIEVVAQLRDPEVGCPWDLEQTPQTLVPYIIEEAYEVVDAIATGEQNAIAEELGDLLLQVVLQAQIAGESGDFTLEEIAVSITEKLIRRHPHVFGDLEINSSEEVNQNWEKIKAEEKGQSLAEAQLLSNKLRRYARSLPPLMAGMKISKKAAKAGFEWENAEGVWDKFREELTEFQEALTTEDKEHQQAELGDLLFTIINIARWYDLDPFAGLQGTNRRFIQRLAIMENFAGESLNNYTIDELETLWQKAKKVINEQ